MSIVIIKGPKESGRTFIANALRNNQISNKKGALLIDDNQDADLGVMLEKIIIGKRFNAKEWKSLPWKEGVSIILVGEKEKLIDELEEGMPGFVEFFGPVYTIKTGES